MSKKFVNLHGHTSFSVYDAMGKPEDYADWVLQNAGEDSGAFAITDHGNLNGAGYIVTTQKKYKPKGIKVIWGVEFYFVPSLSEWRRLKAEKEENKDKKEDDADLVIENEKESKSKYFDPINRRHHLVLVAQNQKGLTNLFRLVSRSYRQGFYRKPRIDFEMLKQFNEGLIASTACIAGLPTWCSLQTENEPLDKVFQLYDQELYPLMDLFGKERFFLELQFNRLEEQQLVNRHLIEYSKKTNYNLIVTADCHYPSPDMFRDREIYRLLGYQMQKKEIDMSILDKSIEEMEADLYLKNGDQLFDSYKKTFANIHSDDKLISEAIERTYDIAHNFIEEVTPDDSIKLPKTFQVPGNLLSAFDRLKQICLASLKAKGLTNREYLERAAYELKIIKEKKLEEYFLTLKEILDVLKKHMITGTARGSGAGSLVNYLLDITFLDPIKEGLLFERFISPSRVEMADVDTDVELKDEALDILKQHFGEDNVLAISNYNTLQLKSLVKDISRLYSIPFDEVNDVTKVMETEARQKILEEVGHDQKLYEFTYERAKKHSPTFNEYIEKYPKVGERIENLYREIKSIGRHAGGVIVIPDAESCLPIIRIRGIDQSPITEGITAQHLKYFGLVKYDILGLATLRIIRRCIETILKESGTENPTIDDIWRFYNEKLHPSVIDTADPKVFKNTYQAGNFPCIFQFDKDPVKNFCVRAQPESVAEISALTAIWRPGPLCISGKSTITMNIANKVVSTKRMTIEELYKKFHENGSEFRKKFHLSLKSYDTEAKKFVKNKILNVYKSGIKKVFNIKFQREIRHDVPKIIDSTDFKYHKGSSYLAATEDHLFLTTRGWKRLGDLVLGDYLLMDRLHNFSSDDPKKNTRKESSIKGRKTFRAIAFKNYEYHCIFCDWNKGSLDVNHVSGNRNENNHPENLSYLCPNHHREYSEGSISSQELIASREKYKLPYDDFVQCVRFIGSEYVGEEETYDISVESPNNNFFAGNFIVHNSGGAHDKYIQSKHRGGIDPDEHPLLKELLSDTQGILIYQEQFMLLANKLAGFSLDEADKLRKLLVKPSHELGEEMKKQRVEVGNKFINGCIEKGLSKERAEKLWNEEILGFISYGFNKSHSAAYAYNSYHCAWLYTYYPDQWIRSCLEMDPDLEGTIASVASVGYKISTPDINSSLPDQWVVKNKTCYPSLMAVKGIGVTAAYELSSYRGAGFTGLEDFFYKVENEKKKWRWSKFNKKSIEVLIKVGAFDNLDCVGPDKLFKNYRHMFDVVIGNFEKVKKGKVSLEELAAQSKVDDWSLSEKIEMQREILGFYDKSMVLEGYKNVLQEFDIEAIDRVEDEENKNNVWAIVEKIEQKFTNASKKPYLVVSCSGESTSLYKFRVWNALAEKNSIWSEGNVVIFSLEYDPNWGYSLPMFCKPLKVTK